MISRTQNYKLRSVSKLCHDTGCKIDITSDGNSLHYNTNVFVSATKEGNSANITIKNNGDLLVDKETVNEEKLKELLENL